MPQKWFFGKFSLSCSVSCKVACHFVCLLWHFWVRFCKYWTYWQANCRDFVLEFLVIVSPTSLYLELYLESSYVTDEFPNFPSLRTPNSMKHSRIRSRPDLDSSSHYHNVCSVGAEHPIFWPIKPLDNHNTSRPVLLVLWIFEFILERYLGLNALDKYTLVLVSSMNHITNSQSIAILCDVQVIHERLHGGLGLVNKRLTLPIFYPEEVKAHEEHRQQKKNNSRENFLDLLQ